MQKKVCELFILLVVFSLFIGQIRQFPEEKGWVGLHVNVVNNNDHREKDLKVEIVMYRFGLFRVTDRFDLRGNSKTSESIYIKIPYFVPPGWYFTRIALLDDEEGVRDVDHRYVLIV